MGFIIDQKTMRTKLKNFPDYKDGCTGNCVHMEQMSRGLKFFISFLENNIFRLNDNGDKLKMYLIRQFTCIYQVSIKFTCIYQVSIKCKHWKCLLSLHIAMSPPPPWYTGPKNPLKIIHFTKGGGLSPYLNTPVMPPDTPPLALNEIRIFFSPWIKPLI